MKDDAESIYHVFKKLKDFVKEHDIPLTKDEPRCVEKQAVAPREPKPIEESDPFLEAMKGVKRMDRKKQRVRQAGKRDGGEIVWKEKEPTMEETLREDYSFNVINLPEYMEGYVDGMNPVVMEKLRCGEFSVQQVLDLHGLSANDAYETFHEFIREAVRAQMHCVKVIHGRGLKSKRGPVLKEKLKEWIVRAMHRKWVVAFSSAKMRDGGPGATTILLRTQAHKKKLHIIG